MEKDKHFEIDLEIAETNFKEILNYVFDDTGYFRNEKEMNIGTSKGLIFKKVVDKNLISNLTERFNYEPSDSIFVRYNPFSYLNPHYDLYNRSFRKSCVTWALYPDLDKFAPTVFYNNDNTISYEHFYTEKAFIIDTRIKHGIKNNEHYRYLLQFSFNVEPKDLAENLVK